MNGYCEMRLVGRPAHLPPNRRQLSSEWLFGLYIDADARNFDFIVAIKIGGVCKSGRKAGRSEFNHNAIDGFSGRRQHEQAACLLWTKHVSSRSALTIPPVGQGGSVKANDGLARQSRKIPPKRYTDDAFVHASIHNRSKWRHCYDGNARPVAKPKAKAPERSRKPWARHPIQQTTPSHDHEHNQQQGCRASHDRQADRPGQFRQHIWQKMVKHPVRGRNDERQG